MKSDIHNEVPLKGLKNSSIDKEQHKQSSESDQNSQKGEQFLSFGAFYSEKYESPNKICEVGKYEQNLNFLKNFLAKAQNFPQKTILRLSNELLLKNEKLKAINCSLVQCLQLV